MNLPKIDKVNERPIDMVQRIIAINEQLVYDQYFDRMLVDIMDQEIDIAGVQPDFVVEA